MGKEAYSHYDLFPNGALSFSQLSSKKKKMLELTANGNPVSVIAEKMGGLSVKTIETQKQRIRDAAFKKRMGGEIDDEEYSEMRSFTRRIIKFLIVDGVVSGDIQIDPPERELKPLTSKEIVIADLLSDGFSMNEIAKKLCLVTKTVEVHAQSLREKVSAKNTYHLIARKAQLELTGEWDMLTGLRFK